MNDREWTNDDLGNYITHFSESQRENVLKQILESELLQQFLGTTEGRLILNSVVDKIRDNTMKIVSLSISNKNTQELIDAAYQIHMAYDFMYAIAGMATAGETHKESIKKLKKRS
jgi:hypothetical protein